VKLDPDPHEIQKPDQKGVYEGRRRSYWRREGSKWSNGGSLEQWSHIDLHRYYEEQNPDSYPSEKSNQNKNRYPDPEQHKK
jgi:hypothetical protein